MFSNVTVTGLVAAGPVVPAVGLSDSQGMSLGVQPPPPPMVPLSRKPRSGSVPTRQVPARGIQSAQGVPKPPPGLRQAEGLFDWTVRSVQPHCPPVAKSMLAWTDSQ